MLIGVNTMTLKGMEKLVDWEKECLNSWKAKQLE